MDFNLQYDRSGYVEFFRNQFLPEDFEASEESISLSFSPQYIQQVTKIGQSRSLVLNVYEVQHTSENDPRVSLSKESFRLLAEYGQKRALVLFVSNTSENYRLSLVTIDLKWEEGKRPTREYSNPKRFSFFLGPDAKIHTPEQYLVAKGRIKDFDDLKNRFSIEVVNKDFYDEISRLFTTLTGGKRKIRSRRYDFGKGLLEFPSTDKNVRKEFAVRLIGRLVFCWFLNKKHSEQGISLLPEELLSSNGVKSNRNYYHTILEPLFFEVLNAPMEDRAKRFQSGLWSLIPFLNGGLFTDHEDDFYGRNGNERAQLLNTLIVPNDWLRELLEIFETYNFTIDENTPVDIELSIEPEMLGRIFENLLAEINPITGETARKATGSYYTPRPIVEYMVDESLKQYLLTKTQLPEDRISSLLSYAEEESPLTESQKDEVLDALDIIKIIDPACGSGAYPMGTLQKILLMLQKIDPNSEKWLDKVLSKIDDTTVRKEFERKLKGESSYVHKLGIIQNSIYGVDNQPIAVEISKLRCFLSLIVDETIDDTRPNRGIEPLPNLEFKFVCGNALIGLEGSRLTTQKAMDLKDKLKKLRSEYLTSYGKEKETIERRFRETQRQMSILGIDWGEGGEEILKLADWDPFKDEASPWFDPEWMFGISDGFDVVIANPPYIGEKGHKHIFREVKKSSLREYYLRKMDIFYFFFHLALNIARDGGLVAFISTNYYVTADGARKLRQDFRGRSIIQRLVNFNELKVFESATGQHNMISVLRKANSNTAEAKTCITHRIGNASSEVLYAIAGWKDKETTYYTVPQKDLYDEGEKCYIRLNGITKNETAFSEQGILNTIRNHGHPLLNICNINQGLLTGVDKITARHIRNNLVSDKYKGHGVYVISDEELGEMRLSKKERKLVRPFFKNSDIQRYCCSQQPTKHVVYLTRDLTIEEYPSIYKHVGEFEKPIKARSEGRGEIQAALKLGKWWVIFAARDEKTFSGPKIVCPQRSYENTFAYNELEWFASADVYFITQRDISIDLKYVLALLNSKLYYLWLYHRGKRKGEMLEIFYTPLSEVPIQKISTNEQKPFIVSVDEILNITKENDWLENIAKQTKVKSLEKQIDQMVYELYGLTKEEIAIVESLDKKN